ncbi:MAG: hypothetical protein E6R03_00915 [Hyphomicrobiaceae bacterium]|nr:MAG: hypothetical protein E6R03_00915 [Hyphomicrobiaceae bacterium]
MDPFYQPFADAANIAAVKQKTAFEAQEQPHKLQTLKAQSMMEMGKAQEDADDRTAMLLATKAMKDAAAKAPDGQMDLTKSLEIGASSLAQSGRLTQATSMLDKVELARARQELQEKRKMEQEGLRLKQQEQHINWLQSALGEVKDQPSLDKAVEGYEAMTGEKVPDGYRTYSPEFIGQLNRAVMKSKDRVMLDLRERSLTAREEDIQSKIRAREAAAGTARARTQIAQRRAEQAATREQRLARDGGGEKGKGSVVPPRAVVGHAESVIKQMFPDLSKDQVKQYASDAASDAQNLLRTSPGMDMKSAVYNSVQKNSDNIKSESRLFRPDKKTYGGAGSSDKSPLPMPKTMGELIPGRFYKDSKGIVKQYNPK